MTATVIPKTSTMVLDFNGDWDFTRRKELQDLLRPAESVDELVLNFSHVTFIDASVLGSLIALLNRMVTCKTLGVIEIVGASRSVMRLFEVCRLETLFKFTQLAVHTNAGDQAPIL